MLLCNYGWIIGKYSKLGLVQSDKIISPPHSIMKIFKHTENVSTHWKFKRLVQQISRFYQIIYYTWKNEKTLKMENHSRQPLKKIKTNNGPL